MKVSVVYALPGRQVVRELDLPAGATLAMALDQSGLLQEFPEIDPQSVPVGVYGRVVPLHSVLQPGDRVEIYRQLRVEPKAARRKRVSKR
jgi:uncharacterized protein